MVKHEIGGFLPEIGGFLPEIGGFLLETEPPPA
jgi:hypothetical protein